METILLLAAFAFFAIWESFLPRRELTAPTGRRWANHAALNLIFCSPAAALLRLNGFVVALLVAHSRFGILNRDVLPMWLRWTITVLALDLVRFAMHVLYHHVPAMWRIHRVHHADPDIDWSTSFLFHPGEFLLTQGAYLLTIAILAPPPLAVLTLEVLVVAQNIFVHANIRMPGWMDGAVRLVMITPDMHRVHHSDERCEQNTNYGDVFPWWDRIFGTYRAQPSGGHEGMGLGLRELRTTRGLNLLELLALPFRKRPID